MANFCSNCGSPIGENDSFCPNCGTEIGVEYPVEQKKSAFGGILFLIVLCAVILYGLKIYKESVYGTNLADAYNHMASNAGECENIGNTVCTVWGNWKNKTKASDTDKFTRRDDGQGAFYTDINDVLGNLFEDKDFKNKLRKTENEKTEVMDLVAKLNNPPKKYAEAYGQFRETFNLYLTFYNTATNPSGMYDDYYDSYSKADEELGNQLQILYTYIN